MQQYIYKVEHWTCENCTFLNKITTTLCDMCGFFYQKKQRHAKQIKIDKFLKTQFMICPQCFDQNQLQSENCKFCRTNFIQYMSKNQNHDKLIQDGLANKKQPYKEEKQIKPQLCQVICKQCGYKNDRQSEICYFCFKELREQKNKIQCPFCLKQVQEKDIINHIEICQKQHKKKDLSKRQQELNYDEYICYDCQKIYNIDENMMMLDCNHRYCKKCLINIITRKIMIKKVNQIICPYCSQKIGQQTIKFLIQPSHFQNYIEILHKNLIIQDKNLIFIPCKGFVTNFNQSLPESENQYKLQSFCNYYRHNLHQLIYQQIKPCSSIISYHSIQDKDKQLKCIICKLSMCKNGCDSIHKSLTCYQYNNQQLIFKSFIQFFQIPLSLLDIRGNRDYVKSYPNHYKMINNQKYFIPHGFKQYGINLQKYQDLQWLGKGPNAWVVMYHGVRSAHMTSGKIVGKHKLSSRKKLKIQINEKIQDNKKQQKKILKSILENNLKAGHGQGFRGSKCVRTGKIIGIGIYGSPHVDVCSNGYSNFSTNVKGTNYSVVIKCRVNPSAIRVVKKPSDLGRKEEQYQNDYWVINDSKDIRPYAFLLRRREGS